MGARHRATAAALAILCALSFRAEDAGADRDGVFAVPPDGAAWILDYDGYGKVAHEGLAGLVLAPRAAGCASTHSALARVRNTTEFPVGDFRVSFRAVTEKQLRNGSPAHPWESLWLFFNYSGSARDKKTNYVAFKTNGIEVGRAFGKSSQKFLRTDAVVGATIGRAANYQVEKRGQHLTIAIDGAIVATYDGASEPLFDDPGSIGFYTEDARVRIYWTEIERL